jgi:hypothetical protein
MKLCIMIHVTCCSVTWDLILNHTKIKESPNCDVLPLLGVSENPDRTPEHRIREHKTNERSSQEHDSRKMRQRIS